MLKSEIMKKKYIFIGLGIILVILIFWGIKRQMFTCGDGVCHQKKEFATDICPQDCGINTLLIPDVEDSNQPPECRVKSIEKIGEGSFPKWSPDGNLIAFNKLVDNIYEIFTMKPDGSDMKYLSRDKPQLQHAGHKGQPYWYPNGEILVFSAQNTNYGTQIAVSFGTNYRPYEKDPSYYFDNLYLLTFENSCGKL